LVLHREYLPAIAAYARAVLDLGYDAAGSVLLGRRSPLRRRLHRFTADHVQADGEFRDPDGSVQLYIVAKSDRQLTRRVATALDACDNLVALRPEIAREVCGVAAVKPRFLWLVGPNTVEPARHVFRVATKGDHLSFTRVDAVPAPVRGPPAAGPRAT
jgi:hypothetical protein